MSAFQEGEGRPTYMAEGALDSRRGQGFGGRRESMWGKGAWGEGELGRGV